MDSYQDFAYVYDEFMDETPYEMWCERIRNLIEQYGVSKPVRDVGDALESEKNLVLDLGCGTGNLTELLYQSGYDMIGVDNSDMMLSIAMEKKSRTGSEIMYLLQDMRELELYSTVGTIVSVCDCVNYVLDETELLEVFKRVNNYLYPGGIFVFDFNTDYKYKEVIGDTTIAENRDTCSFIWENYYDDATAINEYDVTVFVKEKDELFRKFTETHYQKGYNVSTIKELILAAGMEIVLVLDADTDETVTDESERILVVAKEVKKKL